MATVYTVEYNGEVFDVEGPDNASESDLMAFIGAKPTQVSDATQTQLESQPAAPSTLMDRASKLVGAIKASNVPQEAVRSALTPPEALYKPEKMMEFAGKTPVLPIGLGIVGGPIGGVLGEGARQMVQIARGENAPTPTESALNMAGAALVPSVGKGVAATGDVARRAVKTAFAPRLAKAGEMIAEARTKLKAAPLPDIKMSKEASEEVVKSLPLGKVKDLVEQYKQLPIKDLIAKYDLTHGVFDRAASVTVTGKAKLATNRAAIRKALTEVAPELGSALQAYAAGKSRQTFLKYAIPSIPVLGALSGSSRARQAISRAFGNVK